MIGIGQGSLGTASRKTNSTVRFPAPVQGVDSRVALGIGDPQHCVYTYNLCPYEYGLKVRNGYREWQVNVDNGANVGVHTVIPYAGVVSGGTGNKLFAANNEGIWDVTVAGAAPVLKVAFADISAGAGYGVYTHYTETSGADSVIYADSLNGLYTYDAASDTWAQAVGITGPTITNIRWVVSHKQRIWLIEEDSTSAWYLPAGAMAGAATQFFFGPKFKHGGRLKGLFNWTVDGGEGIDDYLVAVSQAGDVLPYKGDDPSSETSWNLVGTYFIGEIPTGSAFGTEHGGELYLLSSYGISSMNDLLQGADSNVLRANVPGSSLSEKIAFSLRLLMAADIGDAGWAIRTIPSEGGLLISTPTSGSDDPIQFYYNFATGGWGSWRDVPMTCFDTWSNSVYIGTVDGRVARMDVTVDNQLLTAPTPPLVNGNDVEFSILTSFLALDEAGAYKRVKLIRPDFVSNLAPSHTSLARFDFDVAEITAVPEALIDDSDAGSWNVSNWDQAIWGASSNTLHKYNSIGGSWGVGRYVAIATKGATRSLTRLVGWDVIYDTGGTLI